MAETEARVENEEGGASSRRASSVLNALDILADPWGFLVLRESFFGVVRFDAIQANLQIARNVLADRLEQLVAEGVLAKIPYQARPPRHEYRLTEAGRDFYPAIISLLRWGDRWRPRAEGPPLLLFARATGRPLKPEVICAHCRAPISPFDVSVRDGPGAGLEEVAAQVATRRSSALDAYTRGRPCSVARALAVIGDRWSFRVLRDAFFGVRRFEQLQASSGAPRKVLSIRLQELVSAGVLERRPYQDRPVRSEYLLTPAGFDLYPTFLLLMVWGDKWRRPAAGPPLILTHELCGAVLSPILADLESGAPITPSGVTFQCAYPESLAPGGS